MNSRVSVVIPTKNRANYLSSAIQSVLDQTFENSEILIIDAASTDNTGEVVSNFDDERIRYIRERKDRGPSTSRNIGIENSTGKFVAFLDDDDLWMPSKLEKQLDLINQNSDVGVVSTGAWMFNENGKMEIFFPSVRGNIYPKILEKNYIGGCSTVLVRKECLKRVGMFDKNLPSGEDFDLWIRLAKHYEFDYVKEGLVLYRVHAKRISRDSCRILKAKKLLYKKYLQELKTSFKHSKTLGYWQYGLGKYYCKCGEMEQAREEFVKAIINDPFSMFYYIQLFTSFFGASVFNSLTSLADFLLPISFKHKIY